MPSSRMSPQNLNTWKMSAYELCYTVIPPYQPSNGILTVYMPKLMPLIGMGPPRTTSVRLNASCYCNDNACKPPVPGSLSSQNFIQIPPQDNRSFRLPVLYYGERVIIECRNENADYMKVTTKEDHSKLPY